MCLKGLKPQLPGEEKQSAPQVAYLSLTDPSVNWTFRPVGLFLEDRTTRPTASYLPLIQEVTGSNSVADRYYNGAAI
jgi:hypothetical protein